MRNLLLIAAAAASIAATVVPASAQVAIGVGPNGAAVRVGEPHREGWRGHDRYAYRSHCRTERFTVEGRHGRMIVKTRRICD